MIFVVTILLHAFLLIVSNIFVKVMRLMFCYLLIFFCEEHVLWHTHIRLTHCLAAYC